MTTTTTHPPFIPIGYLAGRCYYYDCVARDVTSIAAGNHTQAQLRGLAPTGYWFRHYEGDKGRISWDRAADALIESCKASAYDPERIRGRGVWAERHDDDTRPYVQTVVNYGDVVDPPREPGQGPYLYVRRKSLPRTEYDWDLDFDAETLLAACRAPNWERERFAELFAGWVALAPVCGALDWRPALWVHGPKGSGKSTLLDSIAYMLGPWCFSSVGATEAAIRQSLSLDAIPAIIDEAEPSTPRNKARVQGIIDLVRHTTSGDGHITRGSADNGGAKHFWIRSMFCLGSITVGAESAADLSRFVRLEIGKLGPQHSDVPLRRLSEGLGMRLVGHMARLLPTVRRNIGVFRSVLGELPSRRDRDIYSTLLAGRLAIESTEEVSEDRARAFAAAMQIIEGATDASEMEVEDETSILGHLLQYRMTFDDGERRHELPLAALINAARFRRRSTPEGLRAAPEAAHAALLDVGIYTPALPPHPDDEKDEAFYVAYKTSDLDAIFRPTPWSTDYKAILRRVEGAEHSHHKRFGTGVGKARCTRIPWVS